MVAERRAEVVDHRMVAGLLTDDMSAVADEPKLVGHGCFADGERSPSRRSSAASASGLNPYSACVKNIALHSSILTSIAVKDVKKTISQMLQKLIIYY